MVSKSRQSGKKESKEKRTEDNKWKENKYDAHTQCKTATEYQYKKVQRKERVQQWAADRRAWRSSQLQCNWPIEGKELINKLLINT